MGSVRERLDREREAPEIVVPTSGRRTALAAGGSVSTRQTQERRDDAANPEVAASREVTSSASVQYEVGGFSRVRDREAIQQAIQQAMKPEPAKPKTASSLAADAGIAEWKERQAREAAAEAQAYATGRKVNVMDRQIAEAKAKVAAEVARQKKAQHDFLERAVMHEADDLTDEEKTTFWSRLVAMDRCTDPGAASVVADQIRLERK